MKLSYLRHFLSAIVIVLAAWFLYSKFKSTYYNIPLVFKEANLALLWILILLQALSYVSDGWLSQVLLKIAGFRVGFKNTLSVAVLGVLGGQIAPLFGGTMLIFYFYKKLKLPSGTILFLTTSWGLCNSAVAFLFFVFSLFFLPKSDLSLISRPAVTIIMFLSLALALLIYFLMKQSGRHLITVLNFLTGLLNKIGKAVKKKRLINPARPQELVADFYQSYNLLISNRRRLPEIILATTVYYLTNVLTLYFAFWVFGYYLSFTTVIFGLTAASILTVLAILPATPGVMEASLTVVFLKLGIPAHIALLTIVLYRLLSYWLPLPLSAFLYFKVKASDKNNR